MKAISAQWFVCKIRYKKVMEDGVQKRVTESYVIDALSFTEAEERITEEMSQYISGEFEVRDITLAPYREVFFSGEVSDDRWYKAKVAFINIDEKTMKEKRSNQNYLLQAATLNRAVKNIDDVMSSGITSYLISSISETPIEDVFVYRIKNDDASHREDEKSITNK